MNADDLRRAYQQGHQEGMRLVGARGEVARRAAVFHQLYRHSGRNHVFPLLAAHATLWVRSYHALGLKMGWWLSWQYALTPSWRKSQLASVENFAGVLLDINRGICAQTYADYQFAARFGKHPDAHLIVDPALLEPLLKIHAARQAGSELSDDEKLSAFWPHFLYEQEHHVGPGLACALEKLHWPLVKFLALRPMVRLAFFRPLERVWFHNSLSHQERVANGLRAYQAAVAAGWLRTEESLREYGVSSDEIYRNAERGPSQLPSDCRFKESRALDLSSPRRLLTRS